MKKIKQNLFWAFAYNTIAMTLSSVTVVENANLLRRARVLIN